MTKVLIVDDDRNYVSALASIIRKNGFEVDTANYCKVASEKVAMNEHDLVFVDMLLPDGNGMDVIRNAPDSYSGRFYIMTGYPSVDSAVHALRGRAVDYLIKPVTTRKIDDVLARYHEEQKTGERARKVVATKPNATNRIASSIPPTSLDKSGNQDTKPEVIGDSAPVRKLRHDISRLATSTNTILLQGERGTGKKLVAQKLHSSGKRKGELHFIDCATIPTERMNDELFGYGKQGKKDGHGSYQGFLEQASGGTLYLEGITGIPADTQVLLLEALESGQFSRVGAPHRTYETDVRIIVATNSDLIDAVKEGTLHEDLYFLLSQTSIFVPPLRNRGKDILILADHFLDHLNHSYRENKILDEAGKIALMKYTWPGNISELNHAIHRAFLVSDHALDFSQIAEMTIQETDNKTPGLYLGVSIAEMEKRLILETLTHFDNDKPRAAEVLGISLKTLYNRLNRYNRPRHVKTNRPRVN